MRNLGSLGLSNLKSPRRRAYPEARPARLRPSPRLLKTRTHSATLTLFPTSGGSLPRPLTPNMSPRNFTPDIVFKPHDMQPGTSSSGVPSLDTLLDAVAPQPAAPQAIGVIELSTAAELSTVDELSTVPDMLDVGQDGALMGDGETSGEINAMRPGAETSGLMDGTAELETTSELDTSSHAMHLGVALHPAVREAHTAKHVEPDEEEEERGGEGEDVESDESDVLGLPGLPSSMSSVHSAILSPSLQRQKKLVDKLMTTGSTYMTADSCAWGTPRSRRSRGDSQRSTSGGSSGASAPILRPVAGPAQRHVFRGHRIDVRALLAQNPCAAAAAAAASARPGTLAPPETTVLATHEQVLPHVPLAHEANPRGAHFGVLPARRPPPDSVGSTLSTTSNMHPASRGKEKSAHESARGGNPSRTSGGADAVSAPGSGNGSSSARPGWR